MDPLITFQRVSDSAKLVVNGNVEVSRDQIGNLTVTWTDPLKSRNPPARLLRSDFAGFASEGVEQHRNRANAYLVITDPGGALLKVTWKELDPWAGALTAEQELFGVAVLVTTSASVVRDGISVVVYRADYRYARGSGLVEVRPGL